MSREHDLDRYDRVICTATDLTGELLADAMAKNADTTVLRELHLLLWRARWDMGLCTEGAKKNA